MEVESRTERMWVRDHPTKATDLLDRTKKVKKA